MISKDAVSMENYKRWDRGLPLRKEPKVVREEPKFPEIQNRIEFAKVIDKVEAIEAIRKNILKNEEGVHFIGFDVVLNLKDGKSLSGWILEGDLMKLLPYVREKTDKVILNNISH